MLCTWMRFQILLCLDIALVSLQLLRNQMKLKIQQTEKGREVVNIWKEDYNIWNSRMETFAVLSFWPWNVMSLIHISVFHLENNNTNTRKKFKMTNLLQQHSGVINLYVLQSHHPTWISYHKTNNKTEGNPISSDKIELLFCLKPVLFNLSY